MTDEQVKRILGEDQELTPCPFCGGPGRKECRESDMDLSPGGWWSVVQPKQVIFFVECGDCGCYTAEFTSEDAAVEAWNRRPQIDQVMGETLIEDTDPRPTGNKSLDDYQAQLAAKQKRKC